MKLPAWPGLGPEFGKPDFYFQINKDNLLLLQNEYPSMDLAKI